MCIKEKILSSAGRYKMLSVLIDPDKNDIKSLHKVVDFSEKCKVDFLLVGGSIVFTSVENIVEEIKTITDIPVILFPGNALQITAKADALLFISLISGRNPEYLIGQHVISAPIIKNIGIQTIPAGYILIENGRTTSVEYMSNTIPIPADKPEIVTATSIAGELLGFQLIYLEAGSGANQTIGLNVISEVRKNIKIPLMVGGGINNGNDALGIYKAGADIIVTGTAVEKNPEILNEFSKARDFFTKPIEGQQ